MSNKAEVVLLYQTRNDNLKFYAIKVGDKYLKDSNNNPLISRNVLYLKKIARAYNREVKKLDK